MGLQYLSKTRDFHRNILSFQVKFLDSLLKKHEMEVLGLEEEKVRLTRVSDSLHAIIDLCQSLTLINLFLLLVQDFETRELEWEHREVELERIIQSMEKQQAAVAGAANLVSFPTHEQSLRELTHSISALFPV